jgi:hopene-associated glycosyltransferase HpnB
LPSWDTLAAVTGALSALAWIYLLSARGGFWRIGTMPAATVPPGGGAVAALVPARNEAGVIGSAVASLLRQEYPDAIHIVVVDDASSDGTAQAARSAAAQVGQNAGLAVIEGAPLPPGWSGKLWAIRQGIARAAEFQPRFLLLTDADVAHGPDTVARLAAIAEQGGYDLASFMVRLRCENAVEKLLIPAFVFFFFLLYPPRWISAPRRRTAGAAGGCMLVRPEALARAGGVEAIRGEVIDDCALARAVKGSGGRVWLGLADSSHSLRAYESFADVGRMIARTAFRQLDHSALLLVLTIAGLALVYVAPVALLFSGTLLGAALGLAAWGMMSAAYLPMVRFYRRRAWWALTLPAAAVFYMGATVYSALNYWRGRGGQWKGRAQDTGGS